ncbi:MAG: tRNA 2-selenouridine(34) synthase MnmH [Chryseolinea sp.]
MHIDINQFLTLRHDLPVVDVRSEGEYEHGHVPGARNIPILNNEERHQVGIDYKEKGQQEAIKTGFKMVGPRLSQIIEEAQPLGTEFIVHCWRGGMRSANFCQFVQMANQKTHQVVGGYKAYRHIVLDSFEQPLNLTVLGGCTGSGKTDVLHALATKGEQIIDLESLAHHKGSVFGGLMMPPQPSTEQFQNDLFEALLKLDRSRRIWIEDESLRIGKICLPESFWRQMNKSPIIEIVVNKEERIKRLVREYGHTDSDAFLEAMTKITRKLGGQHFNTAKERMLQGDMASAIEILLGYYDKAYRIGLDNKASRVKFKASWDGENENPLCKELLYYKEQN